MLELPPYGSGGLEYTIYVLPPSTGDDGDTLKDQAIYADLTLDTRPPLQIKHQMQDQITIAQSTTLAIGSPRFDRATMNPALVMSRKITDKSAVHGARPMFRLKLWMANE